MTTRQRFTLLATVIGSGTVFLDGTIVNIALPKIGQELPATFVSVLEGQTYVVSGYLAILAALLILAGALSDHFGRRRVYAIGLGGFAVTSALCGLAPTMELLIVFRLLQGASGALLVPGSLALINQTFEGAERGRAFGIWTASTSALTVLGPVVGGAIVDTISWRVAFLINVPLLAVALWATVVHVADERGEQTSRRFDWLGSIVAALAVGGLSFGIIRGQANEWADLVAWASIVVGAIALVAFPVLMATRPDPLVPLDLFRQRTFATINLATFFIYGALYVILTYQNVVIQGVLGYTALGAGLIGLPVGVMLSVLSTRIGTLSGRLGARRFLVGGPLVMASAMFWFARLPADSEPWKAAFQSPATLVPPVSALIDILPAILLFGLGISMVVAPLVDALMGSIPSRVSGLGSAINNAISRVGQPLLVAIIYIAISATFYGSLESRVPDLDTSSSEVRKAFQPINPPPADATAEQITAATQASIDAFHLAMIVVAVLLALGALVSWVGLRDGVTRAEE